MIFLNTTLINPSFDTQTKVKLNTPFLPVEEKKAKKLVEDDHEKGRKIHRLQPLIVPDDIIQKLVKGPFFTYLQDLVRRKLNAKLSASDGLFFAFFAHIH